eukprot:Opistho-2@10974
MEGHGTLEELLDGLARMHEVRGSGAVDRDETGTLCVGLIRESVGRRLSRAGAGEDDSALLRSLQRICSSKALVDKAGAFELIGAVWPLLMSSRASTELQTTARALIVAVASSCNPKETTLGIVHALYTTIRTLISLDEGDDDPHTAEATDAHTGEGGPTSDSGFCSDYARAAFRDALPPLCESLGRIPDSARAKLTPDALDAIRGYLATLRPDEHDDGAMEQTPIREAEQQDQGRGRDTGHISEGFMGDVAADLTAVAAFLSPFVEDGGSGDANLRSLVLSVWSWPLGEVPLSLARRGGSAVAAVLRTWLSVTDAALCDVASSLEEASHRLPEGDHVTDDAVGMSHYALFCIRAGVRMPPLSAPPGDIVTCVALYAPFALCLLASPRVLTAAKGVELVAVLSRRLPLETVAGEGPCARAVFDGLMRFAVRCPSQSMRKACTQAAREFARLFVAASRLLS